MRNPKKRKPTRIPKTPARKALEKEFRGAPPKVIFDVLERTRIRLAMAQERLTAIQEVFGLRDIEMRLDDLESRFS
jgi:hypothetical protein